MLRLAFQSYLVMNSSGIFSSTFISTIDRSNSSLFLIKMMAVKKL